MLRAATSTDKEEIRPYSYGYNELIFRLSFSGRTYSSIIPEFDFIPSAYACNPPDLQSFENINDIVIVSSEDYDEKHPAGTDLKDIFQVRSPSSGSHYNIFEYLNVKPKIEDVELSLIKAPDIEKYFTFIVTYHYEGKLMKQLIYEFEEVQIKGI